MKPGSNGKMTHKNIMPDLVRDIAHLHALDIIEGMHESVTIHSLDGRILQVNSEFERGLGLKRKDVLGKRPIEIGLTDREKERFLRTHVMPRLLREGAVLDMEDVILRGDGRQMPVSMNMSLLRDAKGRPAAIISVAKDITRLKAAEAAIKDFSRRMLLIREDEKRMISADLHDELGGLAVTLSTQLGLLEDEINRGNLSAARKSVRRAKREFSAALQKLKRIALDLRPPQLDIIGLPSALRELVSGLSKERNLRIGFRADAAAQRVKGDEAITLYRVTQEALHNVVRHSGATRAKIGLACRNRQLVLTVRDNGCGFNTEKMPRHGSTIGIRGMRERLEALQGTLIINSGRGKGTEIRAMLPRINRGGKA